MSHHLMQSSNEMDDSWQLEHVLVDEYAVRVQQAAKIMKDVDKSVLCSERGMRR